MHRASCPLHSPGKGTLVSCAFRGCRRLGPRRSGAWRSGEVGALVKGTLVSSQIWGSVSLRRRIGISAPRRPRRDEGNTLRCPLSAAAPPVNQRRVHSRSPPRRRVLLCPVLAQPCKFIPRRVRAEVAGRAKGTLSSCALASPRRAPGICNGFFPRDHAGARVGRGLAMSELSTFSHVLRRPSGATQMVVGPSCHRA